jgi:hypothetical protein
MKYYDWWLHYLKYINSKFEKRCLEVIKNYY